MAESVTPSASGRNPGLSGRRFIRYLGGERRPLEEVHRNLGADCGANCVNNLHSDRPGSEISRTWEHLLSFQV